MPTPSGSGSGSGSSTPTTSDSKWKQWGRTAFDKSIKVSDWASGYANGASAKMGGERFWPKSNDFPEEVAKCERILRAFTVEGIQTNKPDETENVATTDAQGKQTWITKKRKVLRKIPPKVIKRAKGIVIYTAMRSGIAPFGGAGGAGLMLARMPDGSWSAPSCISPNNLAVGLLLGFDIFDVILVINTEKAMEAFKSHKVTLGAETAVAAGPFGTGISGEMGIDRTPVYSYVRSRGLYGGIEAMAQAFLHRFDENERVYYWPGVTARDIFEGKVRTPPTAEPLYRALRDAETGIAQGDSLERTVYENVKAPPNLAVQTLQQEESAELLEDGERLKLPPTPIELEAMEKAGIPDDFDLALDKKEAEEARLKAEKEREEIFALPPPPRHKSVDGYWKNRGTTPGGKRRVAPPAPGYDQRADSPSSGLVDPSPLRKEFAREETDLIDVSLDDSEEAKKPALPSRNRTRDMMQIDSLADELDKSSLQHRQSPGSADLLPSYEAGESSIPLDADEKKGWAEADGKADAALGTDAASAVPIVVTEHTSTEAQSAKSNADGEASSLRSNSPSPMGSSEHHEASSSTDALTRSGSLTAAPPSRPPRRSRPVSIVSDEAAHSGSTAAAASSTSSSSSQLPPPKMLVFMDWDETISAHDTLSLIAPPAGEQRHGPDFSTYTDAYMSDMEEFTQAFGDRDTLDRQMKFLEDLDEVEKKSVDRVEKGRLFEGEELSSILRRAEDVTLRDGWNDAYTWLDEQTRAGAVVSNIISVGWSAKFIERAIDHQARSTRSERVVPTKIYANEVEMDAEGLGTGKLTKSQDGEMAIRTGIHKKDVMHRIIVETSKGRSDQQLTTIYIGDSNTDLPCLLDATYGLIMGGNKSLLDTIERVGLKEKLVEATVFQAKADSVGPTLITVRDWDEALSVLKTIQASS